MTTHPTCAYCSGLLRFVRDTTLAGVMHPDCATEWRRQHPPVERPTTLPKHLR